MCLFNFSMFKFTIIILIVSSTHTINMNLLLFLLLLFVYQLVLQMISNNASEPPDVGCSSEPLLAHGVRGASLCIQEKKFSLMISRYFFI